MARGFLKRLRSVSLIGERSEGTFRRGSSADAGILIYEAKGQAQFESFKRKPARQTLSQLRPIPGVKQNTNTMRSELRGPEDILDSTTGSLATKLGVPEQDMMLRASGWRRSDTHIRTFLTVAYDSTSPTATLTVPSPFGLLFGAVSALRVAVGWGTNTGEDITVSSVSATTIVAVGAPTRNHDRVTAVRTAYLASAPGAVLDVTLTHGSRFQAGNIVAIDLGTAQEEYRTVASSTADTVTFTANMAQDHDVASLVTAEEVSCIIRTYTPESDQQDHLYGIPFATLAAGATTIPVAYQDGTRIGTGTLPVTVTFGAGTASEETVNVTAVTANTLTVPAGLRYAHSRVTAINAPADQGATQLVVPAGHGTRFSTYDRILIDPGTSVEETALVTGSTSTTLTLSAGLQFAHYKVTSLTAGSVVSAPTVLATAATRTTLTTAGTTAGSGTVFAVTAGTGTRFSVGQAVVIEHLGVDEESATITAVSANSITVDTTANNHPIGSTIDGPSHFAVGDKVVVGFGTANAEVCTVTAVVDYYSVTVAATTATHNSADSVTTAIVSAELLERTDFAASVSITQQQEGRETQTRGARGNCKFMFKAGEPSFIEATQLGAWHQQSDQGGNDPDGRFLARYVPRYNTKEPPPFLSATLTIAGSFAPVFTTLELDSGNALAMRQDANSATGNLSTLITDREVTGRMDPEATQLANYPWYQQWEAGTALPMTWKIGSISRNRINFAVPLAVVTNLSDDDRIDIDVYGIEFSASSLAGSVGDDEVTVTWS